MRSRAGSSCYALPLLLLPSLLLASFFSPVLSPVVVSDEGGGEVWGAAASSIPDRELLLLPPSASHGRENSGKLEREARGNRFASDLAPNRDLSRSLVPILNSAGLKQAARSILDPVVEKPGTLLLVHEDGTMKFMDSSSGSTLWELETGHPLSSSDQDFYPTGDSEYLVYPGQGSDLYEFIKGVGLRKHDLTIDEFIARTPEIKGSVITIGSKTSTLYTVNADSGEIIYKHSLPANLSGFKVPLDEGISLSSKLDAGKRSENTNYITIIRTDYSLSSSDLGRHLWNWTKPFFSAYYHTKYEAPPGMNNKLKPIYGQGQIPVYIESKVDKLQLPPASHFHNSIEFVKEKNQDTIVANSLSLEPYFDSDEILKLPDNAHTSLSTLQESAKASVRPLLEYDDDFHGQSNDDLDTANMQYDNQNSLVMSESSFKSTHSNLVLNYYTPGKNYTEMPSATIYGLLAWFVIPSVFIFSVLHYLKIREQVKQSKQSTVFRQSGVPKKRKTRKNGAIVVSSSDKENSESERGQEIQSNEKYPFMSHMRSIDAGNGRWVGKLFVSNTEIGRGSNGTVVFEGFYDGRPVAVKRLLCAHNDVARKEIENLIASDQHPNIVRLYGVEQDLDFIYISLERCSCSLADLIQHCSKSSTESPASNSEIESSVQLNYLKGIEREMELWRRDGLPSAQLLKLIRDVISGLAHLHELGIIHRDLKPQNVLICSDGIIKAKLSDMGISKRLQADMSSLSRHATGYGSSGWQAPEQLRHGRQTRAVDLFSLGCILFYCITKGRHPFGDYFERDMNILNNRLDLFVVDYIPEAVHLLSQLLDPDPERRPRAAEVLCHPLFWSSEMRLSFLRETSDRIDKANETDLLNALENVAPSAFGGKWGEKLDAALIADMGRYRKYNFESLRDLLRLIRNKSSHYRELPTELQEKIGSFPEGFDQYFSSRFPRLLIEVYKVMCMYCREEDSFSKYFESKLG
uniref:non-specific serine/threonine protein kinase n=1 Tax=Ananas comosus var. bracteatus TaxID=296719 RepID=A0A6V7NJJ6_ANACO|nr:unnamed protein product [Ananas comosus var. bracteatus]